MDINLKKLNYKFHDKPLLVGGRAKEYYNIRKSGKDVDLVISAVDYVNLSKLYPDSLKDIGGDLGILVFEFEIWKSIRWYDYKFLSEKAIETLDYKVISLEKLAFLTSLAIRIDKYLKDLYLITDKISELQRSK